MSYPIERVRGDFPLLAREVNGQPLAYLDSAASAQKPQAVIDRELEFYRHGYAAVHRGIHTLSAEATQQMEAVREQAARFINAASAEEMVFVKGTTEGINLVAQQLWPPPAAAGRCDSHHRDGAPRQHRAVADAGARARAAAAGVAATAGRYAGFGAVAGAGRCVL